MTAPDIPNLPTFAYRASWLNRAGRTDRSACIELKASDLWRSIPRDHWQVFAAKPHKNTYLLATTTTDISAHHLADLHDTKNPLALKGDLRTPKSNALKPPESSRASRSPWIASVGSPSHVKPQASGLYTNPSGGGGHPGGGGNPNKGQSRTKMLGLPTNWSQTLTIQRWRLHAHLAQHFFACPRCTKRSLKLFLPMCTQQELRDAITAQLWLDSNQKRIARSSTLRPQASQLIARYSPLFPPRRLQCRTCLALRYGEVRTSD